MAQGIMVALVERGEMVASGIYLLDGDRASLAERGRGVYNNGERITPRTAVAAESRATTKPPME